MMSAKTHGKNQAVLYDDGTTDRPSSGHTSHARDVRSVAHLKMLQSLAGKLNRLNDVRQIGETIATELRLLIDYHNCRVVLRQGEELLPIAFLGDHDGRAGTAIEAYSVKVGEGVTGRAVETGTALLIPNALECDFATRIAGTEEIEESLAVVPLRYGSRVTGAIVISKLGTDQFDEDDVRLLEVLAGQASVALENARLYEQQRREAESAKALLGFAGALSRAGSFDEICSLTVNQAAALFDTDSASLWLDDDCAAQVGVPAETGTSVPLPEGDGVRGRIVVGGPGLDEDGQRLLASFASQASVALQKALTCRQEVESLEESFAAALSVLESRLSVGEAVAQIRAAGSQLDPALVDALVRLSESGAG